MAKEDGRKNNGGHANSGRKSKAEELKARTKIKQALKVIYNEDSEDEAELAFLVEFAQTKDGMKFCAEHLLGKAPNKVDVTTDGEQMHNPLIMFGKE